MSTAFLIGFSRALVADLRAAELLEVGDGGDEAVAVWLADALGTVPTGASLISSVSRALVACPAVEELYADDDALKEIIQDLQSTPAHWVSG